MAKIAVKIDNLSNVSDKSKQISSSLGNIEASFSSIVKGLDWDIASAVGIQTTANQISKNVTDCETSTRNLSVFLLKAQREYSILDGLEVPEGFGDGLGEVSEGSSFWGDWGSLITKLIDKIGPLGKTFSGYITFFDNILDGDLGIFEILEFLGTNYTGYLGSMVKLAEKGAVSATGEITSSGWGALLGLNSIKTGFSNSLISEWEKLTGAKGGLECAAKWSGYVVTAIKNTGSNYMEYKNSDGTMSVGAAVGETVLETAYDIGVGILGTAIASAAIAAIGFTSAPAVVVGAVGVGVVMGINAVADWFYKKDGGKEESAKEAASTWVVNKAESAVEKTKEVISSIGSSIGNAFSTLGTKATWSFA